MLCCRGRILQLVLKGEEGLEEHGQHKWNCRKAHAAEKARERQRVAAGRDRLPLLADSFLADLLPAAGGREAEGDREQKFNLLIHSCWHSGSRRREVFSCVSC